MEMPPTSANGPRSGPRGSSTSWMRRPISSSLRRRSCSRRRSWLRRRSRARRLNVSARCRNSRPWGTGTRTSRSPAASRRAPSVSEARCRVMRCDSGRMPRSASEGEPEAEREVVRRGAPHLLQGRAHRPGHRDHDPRLGVEPLRHHPLPRVAARHRLPGDLPQPREHGLVGRVGGVHLAVGVPGERDGALPPLRPGEDGPQQQAQLRRPRPRRAPRAGPSGTGSPARPPAGRSSA